jgi:hypothetical protein
MEGKLTGLGGLGSIPGVHTASSDERTVVAVHGRCFTLGIELCLAQV